MRTRFSMAALVVAASLTMPACAVDDQAAADDVAATDVTATICADLADAPELDRAFSLMFYYGYMAGREGVTRIDGSAAPGHLEGVRDYCNAHPDATVIDAFMQALGDASS